MNHKFTLDANAFIAAWNENYPPEVFPTLWERIPAYKDRIIFIKPVFDEIDPVPQHLQRSLTPEEKRKRYPLRSWLKKCDFVVKDLNSDTNNNALRLEREYEIREDSKGASSKDIALIAFAKINQCVVVTLESHQKQQPQRKYNYKIPLICDREGVKHMTFVKFLKEIGVSI